MAKITVLMPVYNSEKYLHEAIDCILEQTFRDFEFLIIDDGSTDNSIAIIESHKDLRIRFYRNEKNLGITPTLNKGIELAQTNLIARMDADDISYPERLQKQFDYLEANPDCAMVSSLTRVISESGAHVRTDRFKSQHFYYNLNFICWIYHPTVVYRKDALMQVNMYTAAYSEDFELFWQLSRNHKIDNLDEILLDYRVTDQSLHQVLKKQEYEEMQRQQVLRNIRYYTGANYTIPVSFIECYRHNFQALLAERNIRNWVRCIKELDHITQCILQLENVNLNVAATKKAAQYKRDYIATFYAQNLPFFQRFYFLCCVISLVSFIRICKEFGAVQLRKFRKLLTPELEKPEVINPNENQAALTLNVD